MWPVGPPHTVRMLKVWLRWDATMYLAAVAVVVFQGLAAWIVTRWSARHGWRTGGALAGRCLRTT